MYIQLYILLNFIVTILLLIYWVFCKLTKGICRCSRHLVGKVVIVTGGCTGIGYATAKNLAERGARVILADVSKNGPYAADKMIAVTGNTDIHFRHLDLASLKSVRSFANEFLKYEKRLDILINNAGVFGSENEKTEDGLLRGMQINYFGPFLLTNILLPMLKSSTPSRIVSVSSMAYYFGTIDLENLNMEKASIKTFKKGKMYANSKLCVILMTLELGRRLQGTGVTANCLHPGVTVTDLAKNTDICFINYAMPLLKLFWKTKWEAAQTSIHIAVSQEATAVNGKYFCDCSVSHTYTRQANDSQLAEDLWLLSEKLVGI